MMTKPVPPSDLKYAESPVFLEVMANILDKNRKTVTDFHRFLRSYAIQLGRMNQNDYVNPDPKILAKVFAEWLDKLRTQAVANPNVSSLTVLHANASSEEMAVYNEMICKYVKFEAATKKKVSKLDTAIVATLLAGVALSMSEFHTARNLSVTARNLPRTHQSSDSGGSKATMAAPATANPNAAGEGEQDVAQQLRDMADNYQRLGAMTYFMSAALGLIGWQFRKRSATLLARVEKGNAEAEKKLMLKIEAIFAEASALTAEATKLYHQQVAAAAPQK